MNYHCDHFTQTFLVFSVSLGMAGPWGAVGQESARSWYSAKEGSVKSWAVFPIRNQFC